METGFWSFTDKFCNYWTKTENVIRRLAKDTKAFHMYGQIIEDQKHKGFLEEVENPEYSIGQVHYMPHHPWT